MSGPPFMRSLRHPNAGFTAPTVDFPPRHVTNPPMPQGWTADRVVQLAPDPASLKAGQGLANPRKWVSAACDDAAAWGECQGSGAKPYQVQVDLSEGASKCSCPSRKFPCKHAIGLLLIVASGAAKADAQPAWVLQWLAARAEKSVKKAEKAQAPPKPVDAEAQADRREKRIARIADGLAFLKVWIEDIVRGGIAILPARGYAFFDEPARRMIDAQAPGVARQLQELGHLAVAGGAWQRPFVEQLGRLYLLIAAFEKRDALPPPTRDDVMMALGMPVKNEDAAALPSVQDHWQIVAQETESEDRLRVQRTWLFGRQTRRPALVLTFAFGTEPLDASLFPSAIFEGDVTFFAGNGHRAIVKRRGDLGPLTELAGIQSLDELCDQGSTALAANAWIGEWAAPLVGVTASKIEDQWTIIDRHGKSLPAALSDIAGWMTLAVSGGRPINVTAAYDGRRLRPLSIFYAGTYVPLTLADKSLKP